MDHAMEGVVEWQSATPMPSLAKRTKDPEWERKQRQREYRVALRREKRNRKADEKKQRKLNATILRRMTRNPDKYTKNAERNRLRAIETERRHIWSEALRQAQRLATVHDPSGTTFGIGAVTTNEDGTVVSVEAQRRREERRKAAEASKGEGATSISDGAKLTVANHNTISELPQEKNGQGCVNHRIHGDPSAHTKASSAPYAPDQPKNTISKSQQKRLTKFEPRPPPPRPILPKGVSVPEGEENWIALWDLPDNELERRVLRAKKRAAAARKALRVKQKSGKVERRAARDEKRKVYRDLKLTWKTIKEEEKRHKTRIKSAEDEEGKKIAVAIANSDRQIALERSAELGCTLSNTPGVEDIKPKALGMRGLHVDFDSPELTEKLNSVRPKPIANTKKKRVDLSQIADYGEERIAPVGDRGASNAEEFIKLDVGMGQDHEAVSYNHRLRRKLRRAIESCQIRKELLVRQRAIELCNEKGLKPPVELSTPAKPIHDRGQRALENGTLETAKAERVRLRLELAEFNKAARVLRKQAKQIAMESGLRVYAEMTGRIPSTSRATKGEKKSPYGPGWYTSSEKPVDDILEPQPVPKTT